MPFSFLNLIDLLGRNHLNVVGIGALENNEVAFPTNVVVMY
jgi:hypothetical protein